MGCIINVVYLWITTLYQDTARRLLGRGHTGEILEVLMTQLLFSIKETATRGSVFCHESGQVDCCGQTSQSPSE